MDDGESQWLKKYPATTISKVSCTVPRDRRLGEIWASVTKVRLGSRKAAKGPEISIREKGGHCYRIINREEREERTGHEHHRKIVSLNRRQSVVQHAK